MFIENTCMSLKVNERTIKTYLQVFKAECLAKKTPHIDSQDYTSHFFDWLRIQVDKLSRKQKTADKPREMTKEERVAEATKIAMAELKKYEEEEKKYGYSTADYRSNIKS